MSTTNDVQWSVLRLSVYRADVERQETESNEHDADQKEDEGGQNCWAAERKTPYAKVPIGDHDEPKSSGEQCNEHT